jgi:AraC-like DNA-binding protein
LVQKARQEAIIQPKDMEASSADERFLATITQIIENEITQSDLNVNVLSEKSGYSAKQVYRRIKSLTGQTAVDYIRSVRLKKAAMLLSRKTFTVAEVMYMVGFSNHSYFAKRSIAPTFRSGAKISGDVRQNAQRIHGGLGVNWQ